MDVFFLPVLLASFSQLCRFEFAKLKAENGDKKRRKVHRS